MSEDEGLYPGGGVMDSGAGIVASALAPQLGSDPIDLSRARFDMRRLSVIRKSDIGLLLYAKIKSRKSRVWKLIYNELLNLNVSVDGRGRRDIIRMEAVSRGGTAAVESEITRPGWAARNLYDRGWEQRQREGRAL